MTWSLACGGAGGAGAAAFDAITADSSRWASSPGSGADLLSTLELPVSFAGDVDAGLVAEGVLYAVVGEPDYSRSVVAVDLSTGEERWRWSGGTPRKLAVSGSSVYVTQDHELLARLDAATGAQLEIRDLGTQTWGGEAPMLVDGKLLVDASGSGSSLSLVDPETLAKAWRVENVGAGGNSPVLEDRVFRVGGCGLAIGLELSSAAEQWAVEDADCSGGDGTALVTDRLLVSDAHETYPDELLDVREPADGSRYHRIPGSQEAMAARDGIVVSYSRAGTIRAAQAWSGRTLWVTSTTPVQRRESLVGAGDTAWVILRDDGSNAHFLRGFDIGSGILIEEHLLPGGGLDTATELWSDGRWLVARAANHINVFEVGGAAPDTSEALRIGVAAPQSPWPRRRDEVWFGTSRTDATTTCSLDGGAAASCTSPWWPSEPLLDGDHSLEVTASAPGAADVVETVSFSVDATVPTTAIVAPVGGITGGVEPDIDITADQVPAGAYIECQVDWRPWAPCGDSTVFAGLDGEHVLRARGVSADGEVEARRQELRWTHERDTPVVTIGEPSFMAGSQVGSVSISTDIPAGRVFCDTDPGPSFDCTGGFERFMHSGPVTITATATDLDGYTGDPTTLDVVVPSVMPETAGGALPSMPITSVPYLLDVSSPTPGANGFTCTLGGGDPWTCHPPFDTPFGPGTHELTVAAGDPEGKRDPTPLSITVVVAPETPNVAVTDPGTGAVVYRPYDITFGAIGATPHGFECHVEEQFALGVPDIRFPDDQDWSPCGSIDLAGSTGVHRMGPHSDPGAFHVRGVDAFGRVVAAPAAVAHDFAGERVEVIAEPHLLSSYEANEFRFVAVEIHTVYGTFGPDSRYECELDGGEPFVCDEMSIIRSDLEDGPHEVVVTGFNDAGIPSLEPYSISWNQQHPVASIASAEPIEGEYALRADIVFEPVLWEYVRCRVHESGATPPEWTECPADGVFVVPGPGEWIVSARSEGHAPNVNGAVGHAHVDAADSASVHVSPEPDTTILSGPRADDRAAVAQVTSASAALAGFECSLDDEAWTACATAESLPAAVDASVTGPGDHELRVRAVDVHGVVDPSPAVHAWHVAALPEAWIVSAVAATDGSYAADVEFSLGSEAAVAECLVRPPGSDGGAFAACESPWRVTVDGPGEHEVVVRAMAATGEVQAEPATALVDVLPVPGTTIVAGPAADERDGTATVTSDSPAIDRFECSFDGAPWATCATADVLPATVDAPVAEPGDHSLRVRAVDVYGVVDTTPADHAWSVAPIPTALVTSAEPAADGAYAIDVSFALGPEADAATCSVAPEGSGTGLMRQCTSPLRLPVSAPGTWIVHVRAEASTGERQDEPASATVAVVPIPDTSIVSGPQADDRAAVAHVTSASAAVAGFECSLDGAAWTTCATAGSLPASVDASVTGPGDHELRVRAVDVHGVVDPSPAVHAWHVAALPEAWIVSAAAATDGSYAADVEFSLGPEAAVAECLVRLPGSEGGAFAACDSPWRVAVDGPGEREVVVRAMAATGEVQAEPATALVDVSPVPDTTIVSGPAADERDGTATVTSNSPAVVRFECSLDGAPWATCATADVLPAVVDAAVTGPGSHVLRVRAVDVHGVVDPTAAEHGWSVVAEPLASISTAAPSSDGSYSLRAEFDLGGDAVTAECLVRASGDAGGTWSPCTSPYVSQVTSPGPWEVLVRGVAEDGTRQASPAAATVDVSPEPDTSILSGPALDERDGTATVTSSSPAIDHFECSLDGAPWTTCAPGEPLPAQVDAAAPALGPHELQVRAVDVHGVVDPTPASHGWEITGSPTASITSARPTPDGSYGLEVEFSLDADAALARCLLRRPGAVDGSWADCASPLAAPVDGPGEWEVLVRGQTAAGVVQDPPASVLVDVSPVPGTVIESGPASDERSGTISVTSASPVVAGFECSLDGAPWTTCAGAETLPATIDASVPGPGEHSMRVRAVDVHDVVDATPAEHAWSVAALTSTTTISTAPVAPGHHGGGIDVAFTSDSAASFECALDDGAWEPCTSPHRAVPGAPVEGPHELLVRSISTDGVVEPEPAHYAFAVDTTAPTVRWSRRPPSLELDGYLRAAWRMDDASIAEGLRSIVYVRTATPYTRGRWQVRRRVLQDTPSQRLVMAMAPGMTRCISVRVTDVAGNMRWLGRRCATMPLDSRNLVLGRGWSHGRAGAAWRGTFAVSRTRGAPIATRVDRVRRVDMLALRCQACGVVDVYWNGRRVRRVDLSQATTRWSARHVLLRFRQPTSGVVQLRPVTHGRIHAVEAVVPFRW